MTHSGEKKEAILFFGGVRKGEYENLIERGFNIVVIPDDSWSFLPTDREAFTYLEFLPLQNLSATTISTLVQIIQQYNIRSILCVIEVFMHSFAKLLKEIDYIGISPELANLTSNKTLMHHAFVKKIGTHSTAQYCEIKNKEQLIEFSKKINYPIVLKPSALYASLFVSYNNNESEMIENYLQAQVGIEQHLNKIQSDKNVLVQAEEYLSGSNHSVDCVVTHDGEVIATPVIDVLTGRDIGIQDFHHFARIAPSSLSMQQQNDVIYLAKEGVRALNMTACVAHVEIIQTKNGPKLLEIAARPGGNRIHILKKSFGIDLIYAYYQVVKKETPKLSSLYEYPFAILTPFPNINGVFRGVNIQKITQEIASYFSHEIKAKPNQKIGTAVDGYTSPLTIELKSNSYETILRDIEHIKNSDDIYQS